MSYAGQTVDRTVGDPQPVGGKDVGDGLMAQYTFLYVLDDEDNPVPLHLADLAGTGTGGGGGGGTTEVTYAHLVAYGAL